MHAQFNRFELENFGKLAAHAYLDEEVSLNDTITKLAREHSLNSHQIDRVSQNANIFVNGSLVSQAKEGGTDPRVAFPLAQGDEVTKRLDANGEKIATLRKEAEVFDLFTVDRQAHDPGSVLDNVLGKMAPDPYANMAKSVDHVKLASEFVTGDPMTGNVDTSTLGLVCQTLENLEQRALTDHSLNKVAMDDAESELRCEIHDQILYGLNPATVRDVIKNAKLDDQTAGYVDALVTKVAADLRAREGESSFCDRSLVNQNHSLMTKSASVMDMVKKTVTTRLGLEKLSAAHKASRAEYAKAVRDGR